MLVIVGGVLKWTSAVHWRLFWTQITRHVGGKKIQKKTGYMEDPAPSQIEIAPEQPQVAEEPRKAGGQPAQPQVVTPVR